MYSIILLKKTCLCLTSSVNCPLMLFVTTDVLAAILIHKWSMCSCLQLAINWAINIMYSDPTLLGGGGLFAKMKLSLTRRRQRSSPTTCKVLHNNTIWFLKNTASRAQFKGSFTWFRGIIQWGGCNTTRLQTAGCSSTANTVASSTWHNGQAHSFSGPDFQSPRPRVYFVCMHMCVHPRSNTQIRSDRLTHMALIRPCWVILSDNH